MPSFIGSPSDIAIKPWAPVPPHTRAGGLDNVIRGWDLRTDEVVLELKGHGDTVTGLSLSPDGSRLLSNSMDSTLKAWDVAPFSPSERCVATFEGHSHDFHKNLLRCSWSRAASVLRVFVDAASWSRRRRAGEIYTTATPSTRSAREPRRSPAFVNRHAVVMNQSAPDSLVALRTGPTTARRSPAARRIRSSTSGTSRPPRSCTTCRDTRARLRRSTFTRRSPSSRRLHLIRRCIWGRSRK